MAVGRGRRLSLLAQSHSADSNALAMRSRRYQATSEDEFPFCPRGESMSGELWNLDPTAAAVSLRMAADAANASRGSRHEGQGHGNLPLDRCIPAWCWACRGRSIRPSDQRIGVSPSAMSSARWDRPARCCATTNAVSPTTTITIPAAWRALITSPSSRNDHTTASAG